MRLAFYSVIFTLGFSVSGANASECIDTGEQGDGWGWDGAPVALLYLPVTVSTTTVMAGVCLLYTSPSPRDS